MPSGLRTTEPKTLGGKAREKMAHVSAIKKELDFVNHSRMSLLPHVRSHRYLTGPGDISICHPLEVKGT